MILFVVCLKLERGFIGHNDIVHEQARSGPVLEVGTDSVVQPFTLARSLSAIKLINELH